MKKLISLILNAALLTGVLCLTSCTNNREKETSDMSSLTTVEQFSPTTQTENTSAAESTDGAKVTSATEPASLAPSEETVKGFFDMYYTAVLSVGERDRVEYSKLLASVEKYIQDQDLSALSVVCKRSKEAIEGNLPREIVISEKMTAVLNRNDIVVQKLLPEISEIAEEKTTMLSCIQIYLSTAQNGGSPEELLRIDKERYSFECELEYLQLNEALLNLPSDELSMFKNTYLAKLTTINTPERLWSSNERLLRMNIDNFSAVLDECNRRICTLIEKES